MKVWVLQMWDEGELYLHKIYRSKEAALKDYPDAERSDSFCELSEMEVEGDDS